MDPIIKSVGQVALPTHDMEASVRFYRDILGLSFIWSNEHLAFFEVGSVRLLLETPEAAEFDHPGSVLYLDVLDIDEAVRELSGRGVVFVDPPHVVGELSGMAVWMAFFRDPAQNLLALQCERPVAPS